MRFYNIEEIEKDFNEGIISWEEKEWNHIPEDKKDMFIKEIRDVEAAFGRLVTATHMQERFNIMIAGQNVNAQRETL